MTKFRKRKNTGQIYYLLNNRNFPQRKLLKNTHQKFLFYQGQLLIVAKDTNEHNTDIAKVIKISDDKKNVTIYFSELNKGKYDGAFVIEVFKYNPKYDYKELCGFEKVRLSSGEKKQVSFEAEAVDEDKLYIGENYRSISLEV